MIDPSFVGVEAQSPLKCQSGRALERKIKSTLAAVAREGQARLSPYYHLQHHRTFRMTRNRAPLRHSASGPIVFLRHTLCGPIGACRRSRIPLAPLWGGAWDHVIAGGLLAFAGVYKFFTIECRVGPRGRSPPCAPLPAHGPSGRTSPCSFARALYHRCGRRR